MRTFLHEKSSSSTSPFFLATRFNHISLASPAHPYPSPTHKRSLDLFFFLFCILYANGRANDFFLPFCSPRTRGSSRQSRSAENTKHKEESVCSFRTQKNPFLSNMTNKIFFVTFLQILFSFTQKGRRSLHFYAFLTTPNHFPPFFSSFSVHPSRMPLLPAVHSDISGRKCRAGFFAAAAAAPILVQDFLHLFF